MPTSKKRFDEWKAMAIEELKLMKPIGGGVTTTVPKYVGALEKAEKAGWSKRLFLYHVSRYLRRKLPD